MTTLPLEVRGDRVYAGLGPRIAAGLADGFILWPIMIVADLAGSGAGTAVAIGAFAVAFLLPCVYGVTFHALRGATLGKSACGLRVLRSDGGRIGWSEALRRESVFIAFGLLGLAAVVWRVRQGLPAEHSWHSYGPNGVRAAESAPWWIAYWPAAYLAWLLIDIAWVAVDRRCRALHDLIGGTVVVHRWVAEQALAADASTVRDTSRSGGSRR